MSIEQLLFFGLLLAIPLLERLMRAMRARTDGSSGDSAPASARETLSPPPTPVPRPDAGATASPGPGTELPHLPSPLPPARPPARSHAPPEHLRTPDRAPRVHREPGHVPAASLRAGRPERPLPARRVIIRGDLRREILVMAVLGPCRALAPKDVSQPG